MSRSGEGAVGLADEALERLRDLLIDHEVGLAIIFGSAARTGDDRADVDVAVEFVERRPTDEGYATAYLDLYSALEDELDCPVDLVDVHSTSPSFARVVFDDGVLVLGSRDRLATLRRRLAGEEPSVENAQERVAAAASRLREGFS
jgi:predicted nucleotidyltransferase